MSYNPYIDMYEGYIYCIKNLINNKIYIGQTRRTVEHRFVQHKTGKYKDISCVVDYAIRKYGTDSFNIETIGIYKRKTEKELKEILNSRERFYIEYYNNENNLRFYFETDAEKEINIFHEKEEILLYNLYDEIKKDTINFYIMITISPKLILKDYITYFFTDKPAFIASIFPL